MARALASALLLTAVLLSGCTVTPYAPEAGVEAAGKPDGFMPTNHALKVLLSKGNGETILVAFDRADWYVAGLEKEIQHKAVRFLQIVGDETSTRTEVLVASVKSPEGFDERFKYEHLASTHTEEELVAMDKEWDQRLDEGERPAVNVGQGADEPGLTGEQSFL